MLNGSGVRSVRQAVGVLAVALALAAWPAHAIASDWTTAPLPALTLQSGRAVFYATSTLTDFQGTTSTVRGQTQAAATLAAVRGSFELDVSTLVTGNTTRDRHMREALAADSFPVLRFTMDSVEIRSVRADTAETVLHGRLELHGVTRALPLTARMEHRADTLRVLAYTTLRMGDYGIRKNLSRGLGLVRVGQEVTVSVEGRYLAAGGASLSQ